ncbi:MAG: SusE domain-containing protein, partial [Proteiniphilum sp.]|nr:SusE domain-containing protein [Proteiniphilum sp.]
MKKISYIIFTIAVLCGVGACTEDMKYTDAAVKAPAGLMLPADNYFLELQSGSGTSMNFSWLPGACEDGYPVQYEMVFFDKVSNGKELGRIDAGVQAQVVVSHKDINRIAGEAGIAPGETGSIYWSVYSARGLNQALSPATPSKLDVKRLL